MIQVQKMNKPIFNIDKQSDQLLNEIIKMEVEINKILILNGNKENKKIKQYQKFIEVKKSQLNILNEYYCDVRMD